MKALIQFLAIAYTICFLGSLNAYAVEANQAKPLVFGVVPQQSPSKLARKWLPLLKFISQKSGVELQFATAPDIPTFEKQLAEGHYDIAYMNPYHYVVLSKQVGFKALVHEQDKKIQGIIVAFKDSKIDKLEDLSSQTIAFPAPASFAATLIPKANLAQQHISFKSEYVNSHDEVYRNIVAGRFVAGGGIMRTFNALPDYFREQLKIIWTSQGYTPHAIATHPRVNDDIRQKLLAGFLAVAKSEKASELLIPLLMKGFTAAEDKDWNDVRSLNIQLMLGQN
jgi:phosphonate transport system substrate-binding protein